ncbi:MAG: DNA recombination protein RmuC, partial [Prevotella sp.]|nr:DNA recombination protein RmuC [Prevotella sp.]
MDIVLLIIGLLAGAVAGYLLAGRSQAALKVEVGKAHTQLEILQGQRTEDAENTRSQREELKSMYEKQLQDQGASFQKQLADLKGQQERQFAEQLKSAKQEMDIAARAVLEENSRALKEANVEHVGHITAPLQTAISDMRKALNDSSIKTAAGQAGLREMIDQMRKSNQVIGDKADSLVNVLRRDNKVTGNWGEVILGDLLDSQGLVEGKEYDV